MVNCGYKRTFKIIPTRAVSIFPPPPPTIGSGQWNCILLIATKGENGEWGKILTAQVGIMKEKCFDISILAHSIHSAL